MVEIWEDGHGPIQGNDINHKHSQQCQL